MTAIWKPLAALLASAALAAPASASASAAPAETVTTTVREAVAALRVADEDRSGYERTKFKHWVDTDRDSCNTRAEILLEEAIEPPTVGARCSIGGGTWFSYYDGATVDNARALDIDHMVPLAESWDSGASGWAAKERQDYANDLGDSRSLVAVTARENRSKSDQDPSEWLPSDQGAWCHYLVDWTAVKTRWGLAVDTREKARLVELAARCPDREITVTLAR